METLLISGLDSVVGANLALAAGQLMRVAGVPLATAAWADPQQHTEQTAALCRRINQQRPTWVVHCGPLATASWDAGTGADDLEHETDRVARLVRAARQAGARLTLVATDAVFAGPGLFHSETQRPDAGTHRARAARAIEELALGGRALVVRTLAYGWSLSDDSADFSQRIWHAVHDGPRYLAAAQPHGTPILASDLADVLCRALKAGLEGLYHVGGAERVSPLGFATELAQACGTPWPESYCAADDPADAAQPIRRETSLHTGRIRRDLRIALPLLRQGLERWIEQSRSGYRRQLAAVVEGQLAAAA